VIYKNNKKGLRENVWADVSGLVVGSEEDLTSYRQRGLLKSIINDVRKALDFAERPDRILFGTDWPLVPMRAYGEFVREMIPQEHHQAVFHDNAKALFKIF
jgi:predicted TIM-barrel fold metal-dependent hydrolase